MFYCAPACIQPREVCFVFGRVKTITSTKAAIDATQDHCPGNLRLGSACYLGTAPQRCDNLKPLRLDENGPHRGNPEVA